MRNRNLLEVKDDDYYDQLTEDELTTELQKIHEEISDDIDQMKNKLKNSVKGTGFFGMTI